MILNLQFAAYCSVRQLVPSSVYTIGFFVRSLSELVLQICMTFNNKKLHCKGNQVTR